MVTSNISLFLSAAMVLQALRSSDRLPFKEPCREEDRIVFCTPNPFIRSSPEAIGDCHDLENQIGG
jgi:hypothetical protein